MIDKLIIKPFDPKYAKDFAIINYEWLNRYFQIEAHDRELLDHPEEQIIQKGGEILFAIIDEKVIGTVALIPIDSQAIELTKMGVLRDHQGFQVGKQLLEEAIKKCQKMHYSKIILESSLKLGPAITLYRKYKFTEIPLDEDSLYSRADIRMELDLSSYKL